MNKILLIATAVSMLGMSTLAAASDTSDAKSTIENWYATTMAKQFDKEATYMAPQFVSLHTDGIVRNKAQQLALNKQMDMKAYKLTDFQFVQSGDVITVTYKNQAVEHIDGKMINPQIAARMAVLQKQNGKWLMLSYVNLGMIGK